MFARENEILVVYLPPRARALVFKVVSVLNSGYKVFDYGPLPIRSGDTVASYDGGTATVPEDGVLPGRSYIRDGITFPLEGAYDESDMWYFPEEWGDTLLHEVQLLTPAWLKVDAQVPPSATQPKYQRGKVTGGVDKDFGFYRGRMEMVHLPGVRVGFRYGNDTNLDVYTYVRFLYAEYRVSIPRDPELVFNVLTRRAPAKWFTMPISYMDPSVENSIREAYGYTGFPLFTEAERDAAIRLYREIISGLKR